MKPKAGNGMWKASEEEDYSMEDWINFYENGFCRN